jgi:hypothetical protein
MLQDGTIEPDDIGALLHHVAPPCFLDVALQLGAERAVIVGGTQPAIDVAGWKNKPTPLAQVDDFLHRDRELFRGYIFFSFWCGQKSLLSRAPGASAEFDDFGLGGAVRYF